MLLSGRRAGVDCMTRICAFARVVGLGLLAALAACSDSGSSANSQDARASDGLSPSAWVLETDVAPGEAAAGAVFSVHCRAFLAPSEPGGALGAEIDLPGAVTVAVAAGPAGPLSIDATHITLGKLGSYQVQCRLPSLNKLDPTPATLYVVPGPAVAIDTQLLGFYGQPPLEPPPTTVTAGSVLRFGCTAMDALGNLITQGFSLIVSPAQPTPAAGLVLAATTAGPLAVACASDGLVDKTPVQLQVVADVPRHLFTLLEPATIQAGNAASLSCVADDAYGNGINDFPFALDYPPAVTIKGLYATATKAGSHKIQCVPETLAWDLFTLHPATLQVLPGPPASLTVLPVPKKLVYKQSEKVTFESAVRDGFDNLIPDATVTLAVLSPAAGYTVSNGKTVSASKDGTYKLRFTVDQAPKLQEPFDLIVDGTPPQLTIDYPPWGSTLDGKPSVAVKGTAGDATSGVKSLTLNTKPVYPQQPACQTDKDCGAGVCNPETGLCTIGTWVAQFGAKHGLNRLRAELTDLGDQVSKATRGFYYAGSYYPVDGSKPDAALVKSGLQVFLGKDFFDDGVHDPAHPDDLATLLEVAIGGLDVNSLLPPGGISSGGIDVQLSNLSFGKPKISLQPVDGGMNMLLQIANLKTDIAVKATQKLGPISVTLKVSGDVTISQLTIDLGLGMEVLNGQVSTKITHNIVSIDSINVGINGIGGLLDPLINLIIGAYKGQIADQFAKAIGDQIPKLLGGLLNQFAINQAIALPSLLPGQPAASIQLVSKLQTLQFTGMGGLVLLDMGFVAQKGTTHAVLGAIARSGCVGTVQDQFAIDKTQRMQLAVHDDVINQLLYAVWYAGALKLDQIDLKQLAGAGASGSPFPLDGATLDLDLFLQPILESCGQSDPSKVRIQVGDVYAQANLPLGNPLSLGLFASLDLGAQIAMTTTPAGTQQLAVTIDPQIEYQLELFSITKSYEGSKKVFEDLITKLLTDQLSKGLPGLDKLALDLPSLDLGGLLPGLPAGAKIGLKIQKLTRAGGYTALDALLQ